MTFSSSSPSKMIRNLLLCLLLAFVLNVNGHISSGNNPKFEHAKKSRFESLALKPFDIKPKDNDETPVGPYCRSIVAYYAGTLKNAKNPEETHDVQFQLRVWADQKRKKIHVYADRWNEDYSKSGDFELDFAFGGNREWCNIEDDDCTSSFTKKESSFKLDLNAVSGNYYHLLSFDYFNNTFGLKNPKDKCTKHQLDGQTDDYTPDLNQLSFCVCCDEYAPSDLLGCPNDKWGGTTQKPTPPPRGDITCNSVTGYYTGLFQNAYNPSAKAQVEFQARLTADDEDEIILYTVDKWNEKKSKMEDFKLSVWDGEEDIVCFPINKSCSIPYVPRRLSGDFHMTLDHYPNGQWDDYYNFFSVSKFFNAFVLNNATGQCTKSQFQAPYFAPNTTLYDYCVCCGEYNPDPSLGCPKNPWANN